MQTITKKSLTMYKTNPMRYDRIPGIVVTPRGTILAYWELRSGPSDWACYAIGMRRSEDGGETWSETLELVVADKSREDSMLNNPVMFACGNGTVVFLWGEAYCRGFMRTSGDDGVSFGPVTEITDQIAAFREKTSFKWDLFAFGPGHGIELSNGALLAGVWYANGGPRLHRPSVCSAIRSDDGGKTWAAGELIGNGTDFINPSETCAVQLDNGDVLLNIRHEGKKHYRAVTVSGDGLSGFSTPRFDENLPDPVCFGSIAKSPLKYRGKAMIVFSNCAVQPCRENFYSRRRLKLTLKTSFDDCKTWEHLRLLEEYGGYSDLAFSPDGQWLYIFYEHDIDGELYSQPRYLSFARLNMEWLTDSFNGDRSKT